MGSCDSVAYATARVLYERNLGDWWVVTQGDGESWHVWLELRSEGGDPVFSLDATSHQFIEVPEPYIGPGPTPTAIRFCEPVNAVLFSQLSVDWPRDCDLALYEYVRDQVR